MKKVLFLSAIVLLSFLTQIKIYSAAAPVRVDAQGRPIWSGERHVQTRITAIEKAEAERKALESAKRIIMARMIPTAPPMTTLEIKKELKTKPPKEEKELKEFQKTRLLNVIIFNDTDEEFTDIVTTRLATALCQKPGPIIATAHLIYNVLLRKAISEELKAISWEDWDIRQSHDKEFFLLIPKEYKKKMFDEFNTKEFQDLINNFYKKKFDESAESAPEDFIESILLGFNFESVAKVSSLEMDETEITSLKGGGKNFFTLLSLFFAIVGGEKKDFFGKWAIVLEGHGSYPSNLPLNLTMDSILKATDGSNVYIAGIKLSDFRDLIQFLNKHEYVEVLLYTSCFAADENLILPYASTLINENVTKFAFGNEEEEKEFKETVKSIEEPNFTIISGALTSITVKSLDKIACGAPIKEKDSLEFLVNYYKFFELLSKYTKKEGFSPTLFNDKELKEILKAIFPRNNPSHLLSYTNIPSILFPRTKKFRALAIDDEIGIITQVKALKHMFDNKPIMFKNIDHLLIYPDKISQPINVENYELGLDPFSLENVLKLRFRIVSMQVGLSLTQIEQLLTDNMLIDEPQNFVRSVLNELFFIAPRSPKYFYIKRFNINDIVLNKTTKYDNVFVLTNSESGIEQKRFLFVDSNKKIHYYKFMKKGPTEKQDSKELSDFETFIPDNDFLNTIFNYFYLNPEMLREFNFSNIDLLLSKEDKQILEKHFLSLPAERQKKLLSDLRT